MNTVYPNLNEFFGTCFHQDWQEDSPTALGVVERYSVEWPPQDVQATRSELGRLLSQTLSEAELSDTLAHLGNFYNPNADGLSYREWLRHIYDFLSLGNAT